MPVQLDADLPTPLIPLAWMIGTWAGAGVLGYPGMPESRFAQELTISHDGRPFLIHHSRTWLIDEAGDNVEQSESETGYWRVDGTDEEGVTSVELLLAHPTGVVEVYLGRVTGAKAELSTDAVLRTQTAQEYNAAARLYGLVQGDLLWATDIAALGQPLQSYASARLKRS
jgi:hypothetical protein